MGAMLNGIALTNFRCFGSTFLTFADYLKPSIRNTALMNLPVTYIFTHDSIRVGEDGPTHHPVEQIGALRSIPGFSVYRPADYKEIIGAWTNILREGTPSAIVLPRGHNNTMKYTSPSKVSKGAYINVKDIIYMGVVGAPEGVKKVQEDHPDVDIYLAALDEKLNDNRR